MAFLVDTDVVSEVRKRAGDPGVRRWFDAVDAGDLFLSVLTVGEVRQGVERLRRRDAPQAQVFEVWLDRLRRDFAQRVLPVSAAVAEEWGRMSAADPPPAVDGLLAATARVHGLTLVTRNVTDVRRTGVSVLDPFTGC